MSAAVSALAGPSRALRGFEDIRRYFDSGECAWIAQVLFVVFLVLFLVSLLTGSIRRPIP